MYSEPAINLSQRVSCPIGIKIDESFEDRHTNFTGWTSQPMPSDRQVRELRCDDCCASADGLSLRNPSSP
jgi:hypothetical protein